MKTKKRQKITAWSIEHPNMGILAGYTNRTRSQCIEAWVKNSHSWKEYKAMGFKAVKVTIQKLEQ